MRVRVERVGGIAGTARTVAEYDTAELSESAAGAVRQAVSSIAAGVYGPEEVGADLISYRITADDQVYTVSAEPLPDPHDPLTALMRY